MKSIIKISLKKGVMGIYFVVLMSIFFVADSKIIQALPVPHGIDGIIYELDGLTEVRNGIDFYVHDITNAQIVYGKTGHGSRGRYSVSLN